MPSISYIISNCIKGVQMISEKLKKIPHYLVTKVMIINLIIFVIVNLIFDIKYEQVDDFIIYSLYSGLDRNI